MEFIRHSAFEGEKICEPNEVLKGTSKFLVLQLNVKESAYFKSKQLYTFSGGCAFGASGIGK
jgi:hypothetical protein